MKHILRFFLLSIFVFAIPLALQAQTTETPSQREARLKEELAQVEREQAETEKVLAEAKQQSASLSRDILILNTKIKAAELNIKAKNLIIQTLGKDISQKQATIVTLQQRIDRGRASLADILRKTNEVGTITIPEVILSEKSVTELFSDLDTFESVQQSMKATFEDIRETKSQTENEKKTLDKKRNTELDAKQVIVKEQRSIAANQSEKQRLLSASKGNEKAYAAVLAQKRQQAAQIRAALFELAGGSKAIPFGDALAYANVVNAKTGVSQAFLLAILTQETGIGRNVGTCYMTNASDGSGINIRTNNPVTAVMKPTRDITPFLAITSALGMDYKTVPVSCPQSIGYGGGMGPAQFIASTWMLISDRTAKALGKSVVNPWNAQDAFMASGIFLSDLGGGSSSYTSQKTAACRYYGGGTRCTSITTPYGNSVMALAASIQTNQIDPLQGI